MNTRTFRSFEGTRICSLLSQRIVMFKQFPLRLSYLKLKMFTELFSPAEINVALLIS